ncbi:GNAT family N-acetyltransferase [Peribacillus sp. SCS-37]|uniref:GNAT family N-acetyltransferase n=1 Tax=Paraperibacillus esterisolvens TaxID=3115296 RepID=UPI003906C0B4
MFKANINSDTYIALLDDAHAEELFSLIVRNRQALGEWLSFPGYTKDVSDTEVFIRRSLAGFHGDGGFWAGIWHKEKLAGSIGYLYIDKKNKKTEIGYWLGSEFEGKGLATQSCRFLIQNAFENLGLNKVEINAAAANHKSRAIPRRLGFKEEGTIRDYELLNGRYLDRTCYGLLKKEYFEQAEN